MNEFRKRCADLVSRLRTDAMLRQNDPVQTVMEFVIAERGAAEFPPSAQLKPLVLYFGSDEDRAGFIALVREAQPALVAHEIP